MIDFSITGVATFTSQIANTANRPLWLCSGTVVLDFSGLCSVQLP
jgi:hypothetical protein